MLLTDTIKMVAFRAQSSLLHYIMPFCDRHDEEGRAFLRAMFRLAAACQATREGTEVRRVTTSWAG